MNMMITMKLSQTETLKTLTDHIDDDLSGFLLNENASSAMKKSLFTNYF